MSDTVKTLNFKRVMWSFGFLYAVFTFISCGGGKQKELMHKLDSLQLAYNVRDAEFNELNGYLSEISAGLDSISIKEGMIFGGSNLPGESPALNRKRIRQNLQELKDMIQTQRIRVEELGAKLAASEKDNSSLRKIVAMFKTLLNTKDSEIQKLRVELDNKNRSIRQLQEISAKMQEENALQEQQIQQQEEVLKTQDAMLNEVFVKIGTKAELKSAGILNKGSLFKKGGIAYEKLDTELFEKVDMRTFERKEIQSKKVKILTQVPTDSYTLQVEGNTTTLIITAPDKFWSVSNFLIIQTN